MPKFDATASLAMWASEVQIGSKTARIPPLPASDWLPVLMSGDARNALDLVEGGFDLPRVLLDGEATAEEVVEQLEILVEAACGRALVTAFTIAGFARECWDIVGPDMARIGCRFDQVPIGYALDAIWSTIIRALGERDEKKLRAFLLQVDLAESGEESRPGVEPPASLRDSPPLPASAMPYVETRPRTRPRWPRPPRGGQSEPPRPQPPPPVGSGLQGVGVPLASREQVRRRVVSPASGTSSLPRPRSRRRRASSDAGSGVSPVPPQ